MESAIFRQEAIDPHRDRLAGEVLITTPIAWQIIGTLLFAGLVVASIFLASADYARVETVSGTITPQAGLAAVVPQRGGVVVMVMVHEGQKVVAGQPLAAIRADDDQAVGPSAGMQIAAAIERRDASLVLQSSAQAEASAEQRAQLEAQRRGVVAEISAIESQIELQRLLVKTALEELDRAKIIADRGFISRGDLQQREELWLARRMELSRLEQSRATKLSAVAELDRTVAGTDARERADAAGLQATRAAVAQEAASAEASRGYILRAPITGTVTAIIARVGQPTEDGPLMMLIPENSQLQAELDIPDSAVGFVRPGQEVRLAIDAFPYQRFGTVAGKLLFVSSAAIKKPENEGKGAGFYKASVALDAHAVKAYGTKRPLLSGMTLTAQIIAERQSLLRWLLDPIFAAGRL